MEKLKIWDLEEGKEYRFYIGETNNENNENFTYTINSEKQLISVNEYGCETLSFLEYNQIIAGYFTEIKKEIDWTKVPRGTKVQVRDKEEYEFVNMYFIKFCKNERVPFKVNSCFSVSPCLDDGFTNFKMEHFNNFWKYCRIHPSVQIPDDWYKEVK